MWFLTNNIDSHSNISSEPFILFINIRVLRLRSTDWKSSLNSLEVHLKSEGLQTLAAP